MGFAAPAVVPVAPHTQTSRFQQVSTAGPATFSFQSGTTGTSPSCRQNRHREPGAAPTPPATGGPPRAKTQTPPCHRRQRRPRPAKEGPAVTAPQRSGAALAPLPRSLEARSRRTKPAVREEPGCGQTLTLPLRAIAPVSGRGAFCSALRPGTRWRRLTFRGAGSATQRRAEAGPVPALPHPRALAVGREQVPDRLCPIPGPQ